MTIADQSQNEFVRFIKSLQKSLVKYNRKLTGNILDYPSQGDVRILIKDYRNNVQNEIILNHKYKYAHCRTVQKVFKENRYDSYSIPFFDKHDPVNNLMVKSFILENK